MAKTFTYAKTKTYTRMDLIKVQIEIALCRTTDLSLETITNSILQGIEKQWISKVHVYGLNSKNLCQAQLIMEIDWDEYNLQISKGNATIVIAEEERTWRDNNPIELHKAILLFNDYVRENSLKSKCRISYTSSVNREEANRILGMVNSTPIQWQDKADGFELQLPEIRELRVGFYCLG